MSTVEVRPEISFYKEVFLNRALISLAAFAASLPVAAAPPPTVGDKAPDFKLPKPEGKTVQLSEITAKGPVVLRGYPRYQCRFHCEIRIWPCGGGEGVRLAELQLGGDAE
jgi:AhpC/TSA family